MTEPDSLDIRTQVLCSCGDSDCKHLTAEKKRDFYSGAYEAARLLLASRRTNARARGAIEEIADSARECLEALGVSFKTSGQQAEDVR